MATLSLTDICPARAPFCIVFAVSANIGSVKCSIVPEVASVSIRSPIEVHHVYHFQRAIAKAPSLPRASATTM